MKARRTLEFYGQIYIIQTTLITKCKMLVSPLFYTCYSVELLGL